jgi:hypothetical protein
LYGITKFEASVKKNNELQDKRITKEIKAVTKSKKRVDHSISIRTKEKRAKTVEKDRETYFKVFRDNPNECEECGRELPDQFLDENGNINCIGQYSHILSKAAYSEFRHNPINFNRLCPVPCHNMWEFGERRRMNIFVKNQIIISKLIKERNGETR